MAADALEGEPMLASATVGSSSHDGIDAWGDSKENEECGVHGKEDP